MTDDRSIKAEANYFTIPPKANVLYSLKNILL